MQIFLKSHSCSYHSRNALCENRGFTLVEMLISTAIITLLSTVVIVRFSAFDSTVLLKSLAYEVATTIRDAQVYSLGVRGEEATFKTPYGVAFTPESVEYTIFQYIDTNLNDEKMPFFGEDAKVIQNFTIGRSMRIAELCVNYSTDDRKCSSDPSDPLVNLDVSFRRPEFGALFYAKDSSGDEISNITSAEIILDSSRGTGDRWVVEVGLAGQVVVHVEQ